MDVSEHKNTESVIRCYLPYLPPQGITSVVDIGCGISGPYRGMLERRALQYVGVDLRPGVRVDLVADVTRGLPFPDDTFSWSWCSEVLEHIPQDLQQAFAREVMRVSRSSLFTYPTPAFARFYGDPGHRPVEVVWNEFADSRWAYDKSTSTGRTILLFSERGRRLQFYQGKMYQDGVKTYETIEGGGEETCPDTRHRIS